MNILFLLKSFEVGGLEVVTTTLANKFQKEGHKVVIWTFSEGKTSLVSRLDENVKLVYGVGFNLSKCNINALRTVLIDEKIQIVINQWGLPFIPDKKLKKASRGIPVKIIAVYHNDPSTNGRLKDVEIAMEKNRNIVVYLGLKMKYWLYRQITAASMRYVYRNSDRYMVLSQSFVEGFKKFTGIRKADRLIVQTNPITIDISDYNYDFERKKKELVFVGRLDYTQKRVSRIIETWSLLEHKHADWILRIVGDGPERDNIEHMVQKLELKNVRFEGFQYPRSYYEIASILILTSEYEGFGLVVAEAMSFGVIPVVLGSYSAIYDLLVDGENGIIVPYSHKDGFNANVMANALERLMNDRILCQKMSLIAYRHSRFFSIERISKEWYDKLNKIIER